MSDNSGKLQPPKGGAGSSLKGGPRGHGGHEAGLTFARLDAAKEWKPPMGQSELEVWYRKVRTTHLAHLSVEDICRAVRQQIHLAALAPHAVRFLQDNPLAGHLFLGELLQAFVTLDREVLAGIDKQSRDAVGRAANAVLLLPAELESLDAVSLAELKADMRALVAKLGDEGVGLMVRATLGGAPAQSVPLAAGERVTIGSAADATIRFTLPSAELARRHASLSLADDGKHVVVQLFGHDAKLNDKAALEGAQLKLGDVLVLGPVRVSLATAAEGRR